jgi:thymidine kinase
VAKCDICNGRKEIEVIVMGTDTDWVECPYCKPSEEVIERARKIHKLKRIAKKKKRKQERKHRIIFK